MLSKSEVCPVDVAVRFFLDKKRGIKDDMEGVHLEALIETFGKKVVDVSEEKAEMIRGSENKVVCGG